MYMNILEQIFERNEEEVFLKADGFDDAVIGLEKNTMRLIYSVSKCIDILKESMSEENAVEYFNRNVSGSMDDNGPLFCWDDFE